VSVEAGFGFRCIVVELFHRASKVRNQFVSFLSSYVAEQGMASLIQTKIGTVLSHLSFLSENWDRLSFRFLPKALGAIISWAASLPAPRRPVVGRWAIAL
jgi:hypothetical protein